MKVIKNYLYNVAYQLIVIILPIITVPYISRIFTPEQIGINSFTFSISQYFVLFAGLGVSIYGNRTIAYCKDDEEQRIKTFWNIFFAILTTTIISFISYFAFIFIIDSNNLEIQIIQSLYIISVCLNISWLFMGMEDFKKIVVRNTVVKLLGVIAIFIFVKSPDDLELYIALLAVINLMGFLSMWLYLPQYIKGFHFDVNGIKSHFGPLIKIYIPQVAMQVYVVMDKTMIGVLSTEAQVGYYDMSQRIVKLILSVVTSLGVVMIPHISHLIAKQKFEEVKSNIRYTFQFMSYLSFPMAFGLSAISQGLAVWFFGEEFTHTGYLMSFSAFIIIAITWSNIIGMQLLMPMMKEKDFTLSVLSGAIVNIGLNLFLIPRYGAFGAIISTIVAEFTVTIVQVIVIKKYIDVVPYLLGTWKSAIAASIMFFIVKSLTLGLAPTIVTTMIQALLGISVYVLIMGLLKSEAQLFMINKARDLFNQKFIKVNKKSVY